MDDVKKLLEEVESRQKMRKDIHSLVMHLKEALQTHREGIVLFVPVAKSNVGYSQKPVRHVLTEFKIVHSNHLSVRKHSFTG